MRILSRSIAFTLFAAWVILQYGVKTADFGAFVNFLGSRDGLVHISELLPGRQGTDETLDAPIIRTETGEVCTSDHVWTNTFAAGFAPHDVVSCQGWTSASSSDIGIVGSTTAVTSDWSFTLNRACDSLQGLYCVQQ